MAITEKTDESLSCVPAAVLAGRLPRKRRVYLQPGVVLANGKTYCHAQCSRPVAFLAKSMSDLHPGGGESHGSEESKTPSPHLQLQTLFVMDGRKRIVATREPYPAVGPAFAFIRGIDACAWGVRADVPERIAMEIGRMASDEKPSPVWDQPLRHAERYLALLGGRIRSGPAFAFPDPLDPVASAETIGDETELNHHFSGWIAGEIAAGRAPVLAVRAGGYPVSVCFCARRSAVAAEAGVETASAFRNQGLAVRTVANWATRIRAEGLTPLYSTDWFNRGSLAVARKLRLIPFAANFRIEP